MEPNFEKEVIKNKEQQNVSKEDEERYQKIMQKIRANLENLNEEIKQKILGIEISKKENPLEISKELEQQLKKEELIHSNLQFKYENSLNEMQKKQSETFEQLRQTQDLLKEKIDLFDKQITDMKDMYKQKAGGKRAFNTKFAIFKGIVYFSAFYVIMKFTGPYIDNLLNKKKIKQS